MKAKTIASVCRTLRVLAVPHLPKEMQSALRDCSNLVESGNLSKALECLLKARQVSPLADMGTNPYRQATDEIALLMCYKANNLIALQEITTQLGTWPITVKVSEALKERTNHCKKMAS